MKNTFDRLEKHIISLKLQKLLVNLDKPISLCQFCVIRTVSFVCLNCEEKLCAVCKDLHRSNTILKNHEIEPLIFPEYNNEKDKEKSSTGIIKGKQSAFSVLKKDSFVSNVGNNAGEQKNVTFVDSISYNNHR